MATKKSQTKSADTEQRTIELNDPNLSSYGRLTLKLKSTSPLIQNKFSEKAKEMILQKQKGQPQGKKAPKDPEQLFLDAMHVIGKRPAKIADLEKTRFGIPAVAFKGAAVRCAKAEMPMTDARGAFFVETSAPTTDLVEIQASVPEIREDPVRIQGTADIRIRPCFEEWEAVLNITYNARKVTPEKLVAWFNDAGISNGVGEWRPGGKQSSGIYGTFQVTEASVVAPKLEN